MKTYTHSQKNPLSFIREALDLYRFKSFDIPGQVHGTIWCMQRCEDRLKRFLDMTLEGKRILIIGPGQTPREMVYLGMRNEVVGIDLDAIPTSAFDFKAYALMLKQNGWMRTLKTFARKSLGIDAKFKKELKKQLGVDTMPKPQLLQMDAGKTTFPDASFDFVYSFSVFEHIPEPSAVIAEMVRLLKPGGGCYISLHLFTSDSGIHDIRLNYADRTVLPYWAHLRPQHKDLMQPNAYLNEVRLPEWHKMFESKMPEVAFDYDYDMGEKGETLKQEMVKLRNAGELTEYSDEELLSVNLIAMWRKPA